MKNVHCVGTKQRGIMKSGILWFKNATILQAQCASALSCSNMWKSNYPHRHICDCFARFCGCNCKTSRICHEETRFFTIRTG